MMRFEVDAVTPAAEPLATRPLGELYADALVIGGDPATPMLTPDGVHPLFSAVAQAFAQHRPLVLSPDAVWLTVTQGLARHIRLHAEELRAKLVDHEGRATLTVTVDGGMPADAAGWAYAVELFEKGLAEKARGTALFECDFTTSTAVERIAGRVVALDAYAEYFALWMMCVCGIPAITLTGTVEDWRKIRERVDALADFGLETWCRSLAPIADEFVRAAAGEPDIAFWQRIYNPVDAYGGDRATGWITRFYPYLKGGVTFDVPNPMLDLPLDEPRGKPESAFDFDFPGIRSTAVPATLARAVVHVNDQIEGRNRAVALRAGLVGVTQDADGALRPLPGWHLEAATIEIDEVIDRIERDHQVTAPESDNDWLDGSAEVQRLYMRIGTGTLFDGAWRILPVREHCRAAVPGSDLDLTVMFARTDGTCVAAATTYDLESADLRTHWVVCEIVPTPRDDDTWRKFRIRGNPSDIRVHGTSLALLLADALDHGGRLTHTETGRLDQLLRAHPE